MADCIFCKIINGEIPSSKVYEDENIYAFRDIEPQAPQHIVIVPKKHISSANELDNDTAKLVGQVFLAAARIAKEQGFGENGYRIVNNCGKDGGQTVGHLHFHLLAGRNLGWPPG